MSELVPYGLSWSGRVIDELKRSTVRARDRGRGAEWLSALKELEHRLRIYPQFGEPLRDLTVDGAQEWIGVVGPLAVRYILDESTRQVHVVHPIMEL